MPKWSRLAVFKKYELFFFILTGNAKFLLIKLRPTSNMQAVSSSSHQ